MIPMFSQKRTKEDMLAFFLLGKNEIMLLTYERKGRTMIYIFVSFKRQIFISINNYMYQQVLIRLPQLVLTINQFKIHSDISINTAEKCSNPTTVPSKTD